MVGVYIGVQQGRVEKRDFLMSNIIIYTSPQSERVLKQKLISGVIFRWLKFKLVAVIKFVLTDCRPAGLLKTAEPLGICYLSTGLLNYGYSNSCVCQCHRGYRSKIALEQHLLIYTWSNIVVSMKYS